MLLLRHLVDEGWVDVESAMPIIQLNHAESVGALNRLAGAHVRGSSVISLVPGVPDADEPVWALSPGARAALMDRDVSMGSSRTWPSRQRVARSYAEGRGRISSTELGGLVGASPSNVGSVLKQLEDEGWLRPSRPNRRGAGFYYVPN